MITTRRENMTQMNADDIMALMKAHYLDGATLNGAGQAGCEQLKDGSWKLTLDGLPQLGFFVALAALAGVPLESIRTDTKESGGGCDTCGYGDGTEYFAYVPTP
jgi:hypothetical protein